MNDVFFHIGLHSYARRERDRNLSYEYLMNDIIPRGKGLPHRGPPALIVYTFDRATSTMSIALLPCILQSLRLNNPLVSKEQKEFRN